MANIQSYSTNTNLLGVNGYGIKASTAIYNTKVAATTDTTLTVPSTAGIGQALNDTNKLLAVFSYASGAIVFVGNSTPTAPITSAAPDGSGTFTAGSSVINPPAFIVSAGDTLHFYATAQVYVSVAFYSVT